MELPFEPTHVYSGQICTLGILRLIREKAFLKKDRLIIMGGGVLKARTRMDISDEHSNNKL